MKTTKIKKTNKDKLQLKPDKNYSPCPIENGDELFPNGIFVFNVTKMLEHIKGNKEMIPLESIDVKFYRKGFSTVNEDHINTVDISNPIILTEISPGRYNVIDGNHRLEKAYRSGIETIMAYKFKATQHIMFLTSKKAYLAYIDYWNDKIRNS